MRRPRALSIGICLILAALVAGCAGDRMSRSTEEAVDDSLLANKVKMALYADKQVSGRQIAVEASQGVIQLSGTVTTSPEAQRAVQLAQGIKGVKECPQSSDGAIENLAGSLPSSSIIGAIANQPCGASNSGLKAARSDIAVAPP